MRHRKRGRVLGRSPSHRAAMFRNMASSLFLTERETDELDPNPPKVKGRIVTTLHKAKEVRSFVEKCITMARHALTAAEEAQPHATEAERHSNEWKKWRQGDGWKKWNQAIAPVVHARRRLVRLLGNKQAVRLLFDTIGPRFRDRPGGYTRIVRLASVRLGDAGEKAILELVGVRDRTEKAGPAPTVEA